MPTVEVFEKDVQAQLGVKTEKEFEELCFNFGVELDDVTNEYEEMAKMLGGEEKAQEMGASKETKYKIDIPANRYDLLCLEGIVAAFKVYLGQEKTMIKFPVTPPLPNYKVTVEAPVLAVRPFTVCGVLRNLKLTQASYDSIIKLQEVFHGNLCRERTLVSIGTHDMKNIKWPLTYTAKPPQEITFKALKQEKVMDCKELFKVYEQGHAEKKKNVWPYCQYIINEPNYPVYLDAKGDVLSLPPVINSEMTKVTVETTDMVLDVTATDETKAKLVLDHLCAMWMCHSTDPSTTITQVEVEYPNGKKIVTPQMKSNTFKTSVEEINKGLGTELSGSDICEKLQRMNLEATEKSGAITVEAPCTRSDILHPQDIIEDVAIAVGYDNLIKRLPTSATIGSSTKLNKMADKVRELVAQLGYVEGIAWVLSSDEAQFKNLRINPKNVPHIRLANSKSDAFTICRVNLLPGVLEMLGANKSAPLGDGLRVFEVGDVVLPSNHRSSLDYRTSQLGVRNERRLCCAIASPRQDNMGEIHGVCDKVLMAHQYELKPAGKKISEGKYYQYSIAKGRDTVGDTFVPERHLIIQAWHPEAEKVVVIGHLGIPRIEVCEKFDIDVKTVVVAVLEMNLHFLL